MTRFRLAAVAVLSAGLLALASPAHALGANGSSEDPSGDAAPTVDVVKARSVRTSTVYRTTVTFADLKKTPGTRRMVHFIEVDFSGARLGTAGNTHTVELITNLSGKTSTRVWKSSAADENGTQKPCKGVTALPDYSTEKVTFTIPKACWRVKTDVMFVSVEARKVPAAAWSTSTLQNEMTTSSDSTGYFWAPDEQM